MNRHYDATREHAPFERSAHPPKRHPNKNQYAPHPLTGKKGWPCRKG